MAMATTAIDTSNPRLLQERIERGREQILLLQEEVDKYCDLAATIADLPKKLEHYVMVPIGKRAMMPGKIVRSNEVLVHLGDDHYAWHPASGAIDVIERKKKALTKEMMAEQEALQLLQQKKSGFEKLIDIKKIYEDENIRDIQETEEESEEYPVSRATEEDVEQFFEIEEEERIKNEQAAWDWDDVMRRMEELEAMEDRGGDNEETMESELVKTLNDRVSELKAKGNDAFGKRRFSESVHFYSQAIELDPSSHILYGNRSAAYHRLKKFSDALDDASKAVDIDNTWVKGHYRMAIALASLEQYNDAAAAFDEAFRLCPTDAKLQQQAKDMREKGRQHARKSVTLADAPATQRIPALPAKPPAPPVHTNTVADKVFSGSILERTSASDSVSESTHFSSLGGGASLPVRQSRFAGNNPDGDKVTLEPVGEAIPVKRVSRFKAQRAGQQ